MKDQLLQHPTIVVPREVFGIGQMAASADLNQKLNGVLLESIGKDHHRAVATDGRMLAVVEWYASGMRDEFEQKAELPGHTRPPERFAQFVQLATWHRVEKQLKKTNQPLAHFLAIDRAKVHAIVVADDANVAVEYAAHDFPFPQYQGLMPDYSASPVPDMVRASNQIKLDCNLVFRAMKFITAFDDQYPCVFDVPSDPTRPMLISQRDELGASITILIMPINPNDGQQT